MMSVHLSASGTVKIGLTRGGSWMLNVDGDNVFHAIDETQFSFGNSSFRFLVGY